jgi:hypothetical protein
MHEFGCFVTRGPRGDLGQNGGSGCAATAKIQDSRDPIKVVTIPHLGEVIALSLLVSQSKRGTSARFRHNAYRCSASPGSSSTGAWSRSSPTAGNARPSACIRVSLAAPGFRCVRRAATASWSHITRGLADAEHLRRPARPARAVRPGRTPRSTQHRNDKRRRAG